MIFKEVSYLSIFWGVFFSFTTIYIILLSIAFPILLIIGIPLLILTIKLYTGANYLNIEGDKIEFINWYSSRLNHVFYKDEIKEIKIKRGNKLHAYYARVLLKNNKRKCIFIGFINLNDLDKIRHTVEHFA